MKRVLIADDEYLVRAGLHSCIDWGRHGYILLNDAVDGLDTYAKIIELRPDIVFLDLRMPKMTGLELLEKLHKENILTNIIILSCCDDFESVRAALRYGVVDYINKLTMSSSELLEVLSKANLHPISFANPNSYEKTFIQPDEALQQLLLGNLNIDSEFLYFLSSGRFLYLILRPDEKNNLTSSSIITNLTKQILKNSSIEAVQAIDEQKNICIVIPELCDHFNAAATIIQHLGPTIGCTCSIGISPAWKNINELTNCLQLARQIENEFFWQKVEVIQIYSTFMKCTDEHKEKLIDFKKQLKEYMNSHDFPQILNLNEEFFYYYSANPRLPSDDLRKFTISLMNSFRFDKDTLQLDAYYHFQEVIIKADTAERISNAFTEFLHQYFSDYPMLKQQNYSPIVTKIIEYIIDKSDCFIQLSEVAQAINFSESYLSQLFKKETGMNFITYIHRYKVALAKQMLDESMLVYQVCEKIGFESSNYFAKIFKRFTGVSPTDYRNRVK